MLLYHFPLNTQESIENFTNKGIRGSEFQLKNGGIVQSENKGIISAKCANPNGDKLYIDLTQYSTISICFRVFADSSFAGGQSWRTILGLNASYNQDNPNLSLFTTQNSTSFAVGTSENIPLDDKWHNVIFVVDNDRCIIYYDNQVKRDTTNANIHNYRHLAFWGRLANNTYNIAALTQDIRIYDYALSQAEIKEYSRALVVHYPLQGNELNPSVLKDVSGFGNDLLIDSTTDLTNSIDSPRGLRSISFGKTWFRGNSDRTQLKNGNLKGKTFAWWYKPLNVTNSSTLVGMQFISFTYNSNRPWLSYVFLLNDRNEINNVQGIYFASEDNNWIHCVVVIDDAAEKILFYKNGIYQRELKRESITQTNAKDGLFLGEVSGIFKNPWNWGSPQNIFYSAFSDFRIYATALSAEDIKNLYNSPIAVSKQHQTMAFEFVEGNDGFAANKNGIVQHNELRENDSDVNGCYQDKLITDELIEN